MTKNTDFTELVRQVTQQANSNRANSKHNKLWLAGGIWFPGLPHSYWKCPVFNKKLWDKETRKYCPFKKKTANGNVLWGSPEVELNEDYPSKTKEKLRRSQINKNRQFVASRLALKEILQRVLQTERTLNTNSNPHEEIRASVRILSK